MIRLWDDPVAEVLETMPSAIQRQFGFVPGEYKVIRRGGNRAMYDYKRAARTLGQFTFKQIHSALGCDACNLYKWIGRQRRAGNISTKRKGYYLIYTWRAA